MKKNYLFLTVIIFLSLFLNSCVNSLSGECTVSVKDNQKRLTIDLVSDDGGVVFNKRVSGNSRTILPVSYDAEDLIYYLCYRDIQNSSGWAIMPRVKFNPLQDHYGTVECDIATSYYEFNLFALTPANAALLESNSPYSRNAVAQYSSFAAYTNADLRFDEVIVFHLSSASSTTGYGSVKVTLNNIGNWTTPEYCCITAGIYNINTGALVGAVAEVTSSSPAKSSINNYVFEQVNVPAGEYNLIVKYICYDRTSSSEVLGSYVFSVNHTYEYNDKIVVLKNQESSGRMDIPYFFDEKPEAPSCFIAAYKDPETTDEEYYKVQFAWYDNSHIEESFKIQVLNAGNSSFYTCPQSDEEWENIANKFGHTTYYEVFSPYISQFSSSANTSINQTSKELYLPLGERYVARICASNSTGDSQWVYLNKTDSLTFTDPADSTKTSEIEAGYTVFDDDVTTLNRFRIKYNLGEGTFAAKKSDGTGAANPALVYYESQHTASWISASASTTKNVLLIPDGISENAYNGLTGIKLTLSDEVEVWKNWTIDKAAGTDSDVVSIGQSVTYVAAPSYIQGVKYYADASGTELTEQPDSATYDGNGYIRKVNQSIYTGYRNVNLFANYDSIVKQDETDYSAYEIVPAAVGVGFLDSTGHACNMDGTTPVVPFTMAKAASSDWLDLSKSNFKWFNFYIAEGYSEKYDSAYLTVTKIANQEKIINNELWSVLNGWSDLNIKDEMDTGFYVVYITAKTSAAPGKSFGYSILLNVTE